MLPVSVSNVANELRREKRFSVSSRKLSIYYSFNWQKMCCEDLMKPSFFLF